MKVGDKVRFLHGMVLGTIINKDRNGDLSVETEDGNRFWCNKASVELVEDSDKGLTTKPIDANEMENINDKELTVREVCEWIRSFETKERHLPSLVLYGDGVGHVQDNNDMTIIETAFNNIEKLTELVRKQKDLEPGTYWRYRGEKEWKRVESGEFAYYGVLEIKVVE